MRFNTWFCILQVYVTNSMSSTRIQQINWLKKNLPSDLLLHMCTKHQLCEEVACCKTLCFQQRRCFTALQFVHTEQEISSVQTQRSHSWREIGGMVPVFLQPAGLWPEEIISSDWLPQFLLILLKSSSATGLHRLLTPPWEPTIK